MIEFPNISKEIFSIGPVAVRWYGLMYVVGYFIGFWLIKRRILDGVFRVSLAAAESLVTYFIVGMLIGARLVFVFVYDFERYMHHPEEIFAIWQGGLSFHGAALGMIVAAALFAKKQRITFYSVTDTLAYAACPGLFFGRIGNFINAELYGRVTDLPWAVNFPTDPGNPRHPSQIYQGLTEGLLLFAFLYWLQKRLINTNRYRDGIVGASFLIGYGLLRFLVEFTREPDPQLGFVLGPFSMGQLLCALMVIAGSFVLRHVYTSQQVFIPKKIKA